MLAAALRVRARHSEPGRHGINDVDATGRYGAFVSAARRPPSSPLAQELAAALLPEIRDRITAIGVRPVGGSSESSAITRWASENGPA